MSNEISMDYSMSDLFGQNDPRTSNQLQPGMGSRNAAVSFVACFYSYTDRVYFQSQLYSTDNGFHGQMRQTAGFGSSQYDYQQIQGQASASATLAQIQAVSQERLLASENQAFMNIYLENMRLTAELRVRK
jgi:hypothetical protein